MSKKSVTIELDDKVIARLQKRAKKNMLSLREMIEDIVRRSAASKTVTVSGDADDALVGIFSRKMSGRLRRK
ncbi:MAG: ribbon-helix-helix protein, CopG family [Nanoarchaeota archaeon]